MTQAKKSKKKEIILKSDKSFEEMIDDAFNDKNFKKSKEPSKKVIYLLAKKAEKKSTKNNKKD